MAVTESKAIFSFFFFGTFWGGEGGGGQEDGKELGHLSTRSRVLTPPAPTNHKRTRKKQVFLPLHVLTFPWPSFPFIYIIVSAPDSFQGYYRLLAEPPYPQPPTPQPPTPNSNSPGAAVVGGQGGGGPKGAERIRRKTGLNEFMLLQSGWWAGAGGAGGAGGIELT